MSDEYVTVVEDIPFGNVFAYRKGDRIAKEAVEQNIWQDYVSGPATKTAKNAVAEATGTPKES
jgi:hypothetical protein